MVAGATAVVVGHSERRKYHGDTDAMVAAKAEGASRSGLSMVVCIGETDAQYGACKTLVVCSGADRGNLPADLARSGMAGIAYDSLWAIGSGHVPTPIQIAMVHRHIRKCLMDVAGAAGAEMRNLYGGPVTSDNAREVLGLENVNGVLLSSRYVW